MTTLAQADVARGKGIDLPWFTDGKDLKLLFGCGYYDGPRTGICMVKDREHWFECIDDEFVLSRDEDGNADTAYLYVVVALSDDDIAEERRRHLVFQKFVGLHCDYRYGETRRIREHTRGRAQKNFWETLLYWRYGNQAYYRQSKTWPHQTYKQNEVVGFFGSSGLTSEVFNRKISIRCAYSHVPVDPDDGRYWRCEEEASFTCCNFGAPVCERHKCRCSQPLSDEQRQALMQE